MFDRLMFVFGEAMIAFRRNLSMTFAAVTTTAVSLFLLAALGVATFEASAYTSTLGQRLDMRVYMRLDVSKEQVHNTASALRAMPGVSVVSWIPRDKAWAKEQKEHPELTAGIENPYPEAFKVTLGDLRKAEDIANEIASLPTVDPAGVQYPREQIRALIAALQTFRRIGPWVAGLLFAAAGVLIYNTIRLKVISRRREIRVMSLVGASNWVIHVPFIIEGSLQGLLGGLGAFGVLYATEQAATRELAQQNYMVAPFPTSSAFFILVLAGAGYGFVCSLFAIRAPWKETGV